jgi:MFS superfamily sulfate permease-like transporter
VAEQVAIPAPDITPVLLFVEMAATIADVMDNGAEDADSSAEQRGMLATLLASIIVSTALVSLTFFLLGRFNAGRFVQFVPAVIIGGFFGSIGYKVREHKRPTAWTGWV